VANRLGEEGMSLSRATQGLEGLAVKPAEHVLHQELDGEMVLLDLHTGGYYGLNGVGSQIWLRLQEGIPPAAIVTALAEMYGVSEETIEGDLRRFVVDLEAQGLVAVHENDS
jgi:hypothetical protein